MPAADKHPANATLTAEDHTRMPPQPVGTLSAEAIQAASAELQK
jgi:hypothetical protein